MGRREPPGADAAMEEYDFCKEETQWSEGQQLAGTACT